MGTVSNSSFRVAPNPNPIQTTPTIKGGRALIVAISYSKTKSPLPGTQEDKVLILKTVKNKGFENIIVMSDQDYPSSSPYFPTYQNILRGLRWLLSSGTILDFENTTLNSFPAINPKEMVFFYYSGHGSQIDDDNGDEIDGKDEVICPIKENGDWADEDIRDDDLYTTFNSNVRPDSYVICLLDCCHSGSGMDLGYRMIRGQVSPYEKNIKVTKCPIILIAGARDHQSAHEGMVDVNKKHGYLTWAWCQAVTERPRQSMYSLESKINNKVSKLISSSKQLPTYSFGQYMSKATIYPI